MVDPNAITFIMTIVNILVLFYLLKRFLFQPISDFMENRSNEIKKNLDHAQQEREEVEKLKQQYEEKLKGAKSEAQEIIQKARQREEEILKEARKEAKEEADAMLERAKSEIEQEKKKAVDTLKTEVSDLTIQISEKVLQDTIDQKQQKQLVKKYLEEVGRVS
ncbi:F0F1 ATP synthase subunit B [Natranaerobius trueperi]|uniref:ATP synthase subunit b n=1 Tax=Natranaerobius trueperi TaxID=759412 RepID=A0A226C0N6_9FIRM|nr:F0F1 ATP synthase subunit B [Natranaerobius trueperi]OWZ84602.1 ATP synthase F0 subunit B [Natranaerobius trueperi]